MFLILLRNCVSPIIHRDCELSRYLFNEGRMVNQFLDLKVRGTVHISDRFYCLEGELLVFLIIRKCAVSIWGETRNHDFLTAMQWIWVRYWNIKFWLKILKIMDICWLFNKNLWQIFTFLVSLFNFSGICCKERRLKINLQIKIFNKYPSSVYRVKISFFIES